MKKLFVIIALAALAGCAGLNLPMSIAVRHSRNARIMGEGLMVPQIKVIESALACLTPEMLGDPELAFSITWDTKHLGLTWRSNGATGHAHAYDLEYPKICIRYNEVEYSTIWHEVAHIHQARLDRQKQDFTKEWIAVAGDVYTRNGHAPGGQGILDAYSRIGHLEDVAVWVSLCYEYVHRHTLNTRDWISRSVDRKLDLRYRQKLALLLKYHFLSDDDYQKLKPLFE